MLRNECSQRTEAEVAGLLKLWQVMDACIERGFRQEGILPGAQRVQRRAPSLHRKLRAEGRNQVDPLLAMDWVNLAARSR